MPKHILLIAIVASLFIADSADAQFLRRLLGMEAPAPGFGQQFEQQQFGQQFGQQQFGQVYGQQFGRPMVTPQYNGAQPTNRVQGYQQPYQRLNPQQVVTGQRPMPVRPQSLNGQERFQNMQTGPVRRFMSSPYAQQFLTRETLATIQTPNGPRVVRVQIPNMMVAPQPGVRSAQMPQMQRRQPAVQNQRDKVAAQRMYQQPLSVGPAQVGPSQNATPVASIPGIVQPLETQTTQVQPALNGPALSGPALTGPTVISSNTEDSSAVIPASAVIEETQNIEPMSLDEVAPNQIPELDAPSESTETNTQGAPSILKRK